MGVSQIYMSYGPQFVERVKQIDIKVIIITERKNDFNGINYKEDK